MSAYELLKLLHISTVAISGSLFVYRYALLARYPDRPLAKPLKILPHINDTLLLTAAIAMLFVLGLNPITSPWLLAKNVALLAYVVLGAICLRSKAGSRRQAVFFVVAIGVFGYIVVVAQTKQVWPL